jgi:hypothetical protein
VVDRGAEPAIADTVTSMLAKGVGEDKISTDIDAIFAPAAA